MQVLCTSGAPYHGVYDLYSVLVCSRAVTRSPVKHSKLCRPRLNIREKSTSDGKSLPVEKFCRSRLFNNMRQLPSISIVNIFAPAFRAMDIVFIMPIKVVCFVSRRQCLFDYPQQVGCEGTEILSPPLSKMPKCQDFRN